MRDGSHTFVEAWDRRELSGPAALDKAKAELIAAVGREEAPGRMLLTREEAPGRTLSEEAPGSTLLAREEAPGTNELSGSPETALEARDETAPVGRDTTFDARDDKPGTTDAVGKADVTARGLLTKFVATGRAVERSAGFDTSALEIAELRTRIAD